MTNTASSPQATVDLQALTAQVRDEGAFLRGILDEMSRTVVGQKHMLESLLIGLLADGHVLLEGVPGLAKTTAVKALASSISGAFSRVQFTPDLLPADLVGTLVFNPKSGDFNVRKGPIFANILLADEINRAPSKVQSALLEAMQEKQVTIGDTTYSLPPLFLVLATQNPLEQEGTYPLPEAQVDRFMLKVVMGYPTAEEEKAIVNRVSGAGIGESRHVATAEDILRCRGLCSRIYMDEKILDYIVTLVAATRDPAGHGLKDIAGFIEYGASPRTSISLARAAKAHALLRGRAYVTPEDIKAIGMEVMRHRIVLTYEAEAEDMRVENIVQRIFDSVEVP
ncbi:MAG: MoxR-like ATPase in aerotolerance operon [Fibrobacteria bacterium]|jgi:MoxR-like ATPase|nr:MoxR-like ATPase in aerotolerance operon [Fibrobacteria bacterium]